MSERTHQERKKKTTNKCSLSRKPRKTIQEYCTFLITRLQFEKGVQTWCHNLYFIFLLRSTKLVVLWSVASGLEGQDGTQTVMSENLVEVLSISSFQCQMSMSPRY